MGLGFWATERIPKNTVVLAEQPLMLKKASESTVDAMFELIGKALCTNRDAFLKLTPRNQCTDPFFLEYSRLKDAHRRWLPDISRETARLYATKYVRNAFSTKDGPALLFDGAVFNHSCDPNVVFALQAGVMVFRTCRDVEEGEQLFDRYGNADGSKKYHAHLLRQYGFRCACS